MDAGDLVPEWQGQAATTSPEVVLESVPSTTSPHGVTEGTPLTLPVAPLGKRFLAACLDLMVLVVSLALFAGIFLLAGGAARPRPLNFVVGVVVVAIIVFLYFGLFTLLTSATPGLRWLGIEVRKLNGELPSAREAFWRALGYLVSIEALSLGFIWSVIDEERLTWHDRISRTFLAMAGFSHQSPRERIRATYKQQHKAYR